MRSTNLRAWRRRYRSAAALDTGIPVEATGPRSALIASVAPPMVMYDCILGRPMLTAAQLESIVDGVLLPLVDSA
ncbi:hypothetical protein LX83_005343 [Goodfellowiella coeruleoviolacea]|uniref:Tetracyclin repressor-like C-terminal domain-containing protein n=1 Tax=Goodfellowiella coeruleoviolacea TaxID=334858 RepID=A0AAE3GJ57_9PSEU|nr:hypothetical protein [Goodfellowiella coeruleoviolacea]